MAYLPFFIKPSSPQKEKTLSVYLREKTLCISVKNILLKRKHRCLYIMIK